MAMAAPLIAMGASAAAPYISQNALKLLSPLAESALNKVISSGAIGKIGGKLANRFFGKKHSTARKLMNKAKKAAKFAVSDEGTAMLNQGLDIGEALGAIDKGTVDSVKEKHSDAKDMHEKALSIHDQLSGFNKIPHMV